MRENNSIWFIIALLVIFLLWLTSCDKKVVFVDRIKEVVRVDSVCPVNLAKEGKYYFAGVVYRDSYGDNAFVTDVYQTTDTTEEFKYRFMDEAITSLSNIKKTFDIRKRKIFFLRSYKRASERRLKFLNTGK